MKLLNGVLSRWNSSQLRIRMRGYRILKKTGKLDSIARIKNGLTEKSLCIDADIFSSLIFGSAVGSEELVVRQYLLLRICGLGFSAALLRAFASPQKKFIYPIPFQWRVTLEEYGLRPIHWQCEIIWKLYIFLAWGYGIFQIWIVFFEALKSWFTYPFSKEKYIYFVSLDRNNLPKSGSNIINHDIISWYIQWSGRNQQISSVRHDVIESRPINLAGITVCKQAKPLPPLPKLRLFIKYLFWGLVVCITSMHSLLRGRWWDPLLLNQAALRAQVEFLPNDLLAREYFFHNSAWIYRPLWTYELEAKDSRATLYFYSTNCEGFKSPKGYPTPTYGYKSMNWPNYLVWDQYQYDFIRRVTNTKSNIIEVGPIWFSSNGKKVELKGRKYIGLFDVTPVRFSQYCLLGDQAEFYTSSIANAFVMDVIAKAKVNGVQVLWKRKRDIGRMAHPCYRFNQSNVEKNQSVICIEPDISAFDMIKVCSAVISMPFTSTALIARSIGIPSVYYDPLGKIQRDDRGAHGINILIGSDELGSWMDGILNV